MADVEKALLKNFDINDELSAAVIMKQLAKDGTGRCFSFTECRVYGVKDFNELLQKRYGQKDFFFAVGKMAEWSKNVIAKEASREVRYGMHGNRAI